MNPIWGHSIFSGKAYAKPTSMPPDVGGREKKEESGILQATAAHIPDLKGEQVFTVLRPPYGSAR
jgi:hypothetical protein